MLNHKWIKIGMTTLVAAALLAGCSTKEAEQTQVPEAEKATITVSHDLGITKAPINPQKVVVFDYGTLDTLDALGIPVVGVAKSNLPAFLDKYKDEAVADVGSLFEPDFEKINSLKPDVIFIMGRQSKHYEALSEIAPVVYMNVGESNYLGDVKRNATLLGEIFSKQTEAEKAISDLEARAKTISETALSTEKKALVLMANEGEMSVYGSNSRFGLIFQSLGFTSADQAVEEATHGMKVGYEYLAEKNPEFLFVVDRGVVTGGKASAEQVLGNELVKQTAASKNQRIISLDAGVWYIAFGGVQGTGIMMDEIQGAVK